MRGYTIQQPLHHDTVVLHLPAVTPEVFRVESIKGGNRSALLYGRDSCFCPPATRGHGTMSIGEATKHTGQRNSQVGTGSPMRERTLIQCWRDAEQ